MHPAKSVIFFTTASGAGYGLIAALGLAAALSELPDDPAFAVVAFVLALGLVTAGLLASTFHLGHRERAWRALSQWRSSWLSREGVAAVVTYLPALAFALAALAEGFQSHITEVLGGLAAVGACVTVYCTAMIYASLKAIPDWAHRSTVWSYLLLSGFTGWLILHLLLRLWPGLATGSGIAAMVLGSLAFAAKLWAWSRIDAGTSESSPESATGLGRIGEVRLLEAPHSQPNYLLKEMGFVIARRHAAALRRAVVVCAFFAPVGLVAIAVLVGGIAASAMAGLAVAAAAVGVALERWLFFAEARHVVTLYYGRRIGAAA